MASLDLTSAIRFTAAWRAEIVASRRLCADEVPLSASGLRDKQKILQADGKAVIHGLLVDASYWHPGFGYTRGELVCHYMTLPVIVTLAGADRKYSGLYGFLNIYAADMYYGSYSLPTYKTIWNAEAFVLTTGSGYHYVCSQLCYFAPKTENFHRLNSCEGIFQQESRNVLFI